MYFYNKIYNKMLNWITNKLTQGFNFVSETLSQRYNYVRNSLNSFLNRNQTALAQQNLQNEDKSYISDISTRRTYGTTLT